jgi:alanyl-tRNA synthetase
MLSANEIRQQFIDFFVQKHGHTFVPSSSVVPLDDPTLMFTNAGMNQFKDVFLGIGTRPYRRAVDSQKCIRVSGKHNDLEEVGRDTYHHTFFEMLGNWSFGDYYKAEAIRWAWELLTKEWGIDKSRLHATVFGGDKEYGLEADDEAFHLWTEVTDIDPTRVHRFGKKDNFWMMGETGPCGPCSEIHIDRTPDKSGGKLVNAGDARVMEIWNLVFIQFNATIDREGEAALKNLDALIGLSPDEQQDRRQEILKKHTHYHLLPAKHVDTGMGFERITAVLQGKDSNYDTDIFSPILEAIGQLTGKKYGARLDDLTDVGFRVVADHLRMATFAIADGARPSNKDQGYEVRRVLRRAVRFCWQCFGQREPFIYKLVPVLADHMGGAYPELKLHQDRTAKIIKDEEADFLRTIKRGLALFEEAAERAEKRNRVISGEDVFNLYTTYGFPPDLTHQMANERRLEVDEDDYKRRMQRHREAPGGQAVAQQTALNVSGGLPEIDDLPKWSGLTCDGKVLGWIAENAFHSSGVIPPGSTVGLLLDRTCFYAEQGGQVGDKGTIRSQTGVFKVSDTVKVGNATVHVGQVTKGRVEVGQSAKLTVDPEREFTRKNHTATHLLHWALQKVLGEHVEQRGSKVKPDEFTFDFSHTGPLTEEEKAEVERLVNEKVYQDLPVTWRELPIDEARKLPGVRAFFGDKYGEVVRVVEIHENRFIPGTSPLPTKGWEKFVFSREFCGGTHLEHTGQIGFFKIVGEEAVGKGVRRLTCVTAREAVARVQKEDAILADLAGRFRCQPEELPARVEGLQEEIKRLQQQLKKGTASDLQSSADKLMASATEVGGVKIIIGQMPPGPQEQMLQQVDRLRQKAPSAVVVIGWSEDSRVQLIAAVTDDLTKKGLHAGKLIGQVAKVVGGGGGGKPTMAQAGGKDPAKLSEALELAKNLATQQLSG